jgi:uncharacterized protein
MHFLFAGLIGLVGGVSSGLFGVGGGIVMVPAMMLLLGVSVKTAIGTSLAVIIPTALMGTFKHHHLGNIDWRLALALAPMAILGGYLGATLTHYIRAEQLKQAFGVFLMLVGLRLLLFK